MSLLSELQASRDREEREAQRCAAAHLTGAHARHAEAARVYQECIDLVIEHIGVTPEREDQS